MNPNLSRVALRPRGPFEVFDLTLRLIRERARPLSRMLAWVAVPPAVVLAVLAGVVAAVWGPTATWWVAGAAVLIGPAVQAPFTVLGGRLLFDEDASVRDCLRATLRSTPGLLAAWTVRLLALGLLCTGFGVILLPAVLFLTETAVLERVPLARGVRRAARLASGQVGPATVGTFGSWGLLVWGAVLGETTGQAVVGFVLQLGSVFGTLTAGLATPWLVAGIVLVQPLIALYRLLLYVDVRTRLEGWDLQVGLRALGLGARR